MVEMTDEQVVLSSLHTKALNAISALTGDPEERFAAAADFYAEATEVEQDYMMALGEAAGIAMAFARMRGLDEETAFSYLVYAAPAPLTTSTAAFILSAGLASQVD